MLAAAVPATCEPGVRLNYICDVERPEDLVAIPGTRFIVTSGFAPGAGLKLVDTEAHRATLWFTGGPGQIDADRARYPSCPGPVDPKLFNARGLALRRTGEGRWSLHVVNHGGRESIEVFDVILVGATPRLV
ncbi:MAG TPA: hypothetical protein VK980_16305, partial [Sphingomonas sp.]|nr:hypothetical protein [Sphingomonas sp.]